MNSIVVVAAMRRVALLLSMFLASAVCLGQSSISPVVTATPEQLFNWAEQNYASLFPAGPKTQTLADPGGLVNYRQYTSTGNAIGVQNQNILGLGSFTNGQPQILARLADVSCQILPNLCVFGSAGSARYVNWQELVTPESFCTVVQYQGAVFCGAWRQNGSSWSAISAAPPSQSRTNSGRHYISQSGNYVDVDSGATLRDPASIFGWDGGSDAVRASSRYFELTTNGGVSWTPLTKYRIGSRMDGSVLVTEKLAYAHGSIIAAIAYYPPQDISPSKYFLAVSPDSGQTWFESVTLPKVRDLFINSAARGYVATDQGVYALRFVNSIVLDNLPFEGGGSPAVTRLYFVGTARDTIFANTSFSGFYLLNAITGTFYQPTPAWSAISYLNYVDNGANGAIVVGRGSRSYSTAYPLVLHATE